MLLQFGDADQDAKNFALLLGSLLLMLGLSIWFIRSSGYSRRVRWTGGLLPWAVMFSFLSMVKLVNNGDVGFVDWQWRWTSALDERLEQLDVANAIGDWSKTPEDYPRFLGNGYWAEVEGVELVTDWKISPPKELWRQKIGAGWSGFSIVGHYAITQEQRGPEELVTCYEVRSGEIVWTHSDSVRWDPMGAGSMGGIGPRATPTIFDQRVVTQGATGIVNCLDALTGKVIWSHDTLVENQVGNVMWGKAGSPLVVENVEGRNLVVISVGGKDGRSLVAYDLETGSEVWAGGDYRSSYASPIVVNMAGQRQILSVNEFFVTGHRVTDGSVLWETPWDGNSDTDATCSQPIPLSGDRIFLSKGYGVGASLLQLQTDGNSIHARPLWQPEIKRVMKTKMSNALVRDGHIYGLDGGLMECIEIGTGRKRWKKRRSPAVGHGQILLIGKVILVLTESGELLLTEASPEKYRELAAMRVFPDEQVTWNTPAFSSPYLLVRNAEQAVCYELVLEENSPEASDLGAISANTN